MKSKAHSLTQLHAGFNRMTSKIKKWPVMLSMVDGYNERSDLQNRLFHRHFAEIAKFENWTPEYAKCYCKLMYGMHILAAQKDKAGNSTPDGEWYTWILGRLEALPFEEQIKFMLKTPVTSEFNAKEGAEFVNTVMREWSMRGCPLTDPTEIDPEYYRDLEKEMVSRGR